MVLNENECSNALYNANHTELHVSTLMGFWYTTIAPSKATSTKQRLQNVMFAIFHVTEASILCEQF